MIRGRVTEALDPVIELGLKQGGFAQRLTDGPGHLEEGGLRAAGDLLHHFRRVAAEMALHHLEHAARVPECLVALGRRLPEGTDHLLERLAQRIAEVTSTSVQPACRCRHESLPGWSTSKL